MFLLLQCVLHTLPNALLVFNSNANFCKTHYSEPNNVLSCVLTHLSSFGIAKIKNLHMYGDVLLNVKPPSFKPAWNDHSYITRSLELLMLLYVQTVYMYIV